MNNYGLSLNYMNTEQCDKFTIVLAETAISNKTQTKQHRPCQSYVEIEFQKENEASYFSYICFQNYYCHQITVKQFSGKPGGDRKDEKQWKTLLKNYTLM